MSQAESNQPFILPMLPMREEVIFPRTTLPFFIGRKPSMEALERSLTMDRKVFVACQKNSAVEKPTRADLCEIGVVGNVLQIMRLPNGTIKALFEAKQRARILQAGMKEGAFMAEVEPLFDELPEGDSFAQLVQQVMTTLEQYLSVFKPKAREEMLSAIKKASYLEVADTIAPMVDINRDRKQEILETLDSYERLRKVNNILVEELSIKQLEDKMKRQAQEQIKSAQKEGYLQDQLRSIQKELGQNDDGRTEFDDFQEKIKEAKMSKEAEEVALKELKKLRLMSPMSSEANVVRNYLEWLISMPWVIRTDDNFDLKRAQTILDEDHYGLEKVKERIIEYMAVAQLKGSLKGPILCLVGPPGVGKTSLAKSIARALDRNFVRMSLGGVRDEAEIRGHRRTYIGALPGKIIQSIRKAKSRNPLLLMDEIDKLFQSAMSDPSAALLEVLDPEQNSTFMDHYLEVEYSLSDVLFLCTANTIQTIPAPLLDRMEVIRLSGYTETEKMHIANQFIIPKQMELHGIEANQLSFRDAAVLEIIQSYTREAGVRNMEREISKLCRKVVTQLVKGKQKSQSTVTVNLVHKYLGVPRFKHDTKEESNEIGITMGLGVTSLGGELMLIEAGRMPGQGRLLLTGKLGDVMQESAHAAYSYVRANAANLGIDAKMFAKYDIHIHIPEGATPKDGPSAGLALITSIVSALNRIPVRHDVAMTGEITLRGHVTEIGGLKEKLLAAHRGLITEVLIPEDNRKDLEDVPKEVLNALNLRIVRTVDEALRVALEHYPEPFQEEVETSLEKSPTAEVITAD